MGNVIIKLEALMKARDVSKNKVCKNCDIQRAQLNRYMNNEMDRVDLSILARLCHYLGCDISSILEYKED